VLQKRYSCVAFSEATSSLPSLFWHESHAMNQHALLRQRRKTRVSSGWCGVNMLAR